MKKLLFIVLFTHFAFAQMPTWLEEIYEKNNNYFELECSYFSPQTHKIIIPQVDTVKEGSLAHRSFQIITPNSEANLRFELSIDDKDKVYAEVYLNNDLYYSERIKRTKHREFYLPFSRDNNGLETEDIFCEVNFAENKPVKISEDTHLNIHPHTNYDFDSLTVEATKPMFNAFTSMLMLEDGNYKGNNVDLEEFMKTDSISLYQEYWELIDKSKKDNVEYVVSPAGHNRFVWDTLNLVNIHYTGGNHNYCIWNNTRNMLRAYIKSFSSEPVIVNYHMNAIVAQWGGIINGLSFPKKLYNESNLLSNLLNNNPEVMDYIKSYHNYFVNDYLSEFKGYFSEIEISTVYQGKVLSKKVRGSGDLTKKIEFKYIE